MLKNNYDLYIWQAITWKFFHKISLYQDPLKSEAYKIFFNSFKTLIPCSVCRNHYIKMLEDDNFDLCKNINKNNLFNFTINIHNNVNLRLGRKIWKHEYSKKFYNSFFLDFHEVKRFLKIYIFHSYKKGPEKTNKLFEMIRAFTHIFPRHNVREKLIKYQQVVKPNVNNFHKWIRGYLIIIKKEM